MCCTTWKINFKHHYMGTCAEVQGLGKQRMTLIRQGAAKQPGAHAALLALGLRIEGHRWAPDARRSIRAGVAVLKAGVSTERPGDEGAGPRHRQEQSSPPNSWGSPRLTHGLTAAPAVHEPGELQQELSTVVIGTGPRIRQGEPTLQASKLRPVDCTAATYPQGESWQKTT